MRLFALKDNTDPDGDILAILSYYEKADEYYIDMPQDTDPWTVPFVLSSFAARGNWRVDSEWSRRWVESRLVPRSRQNLGEILRVNGLDDYDTLRLLVMTQGENSQDDCYLESLRLADCPAWFLERERNRVVESIALEGQRLLVAFRSGEVRLYSGEDILELDGTLARILSDEEMFGCVEVSPGGRGVRWSHSLDIGDDELANAGITLALSWDDLRRIAPILLLDASEAAEALGCSRQNLHALAKRGSLSAVKKGGKTTLYLRADVRARQSDGDTRTRYASLRM